MPVAPQAGNRPRPAYVDRLSEFASSTRLEDIPPGVLDRCRRVIADNVAVITAGMQSPELQALAPIFLEGAAPGSAWVLGAGRKARSREAGYLNGMAGTWHDYDEGHTAAKCHPGIQVTPGALAYAQEAGASGRDLLAAVAIGYEVCARVGWASQMRFEVHPHGTTGTIGSAVAIGRLKRFGDGKMREVLNIAATMAMTTNRQAMLDEATVRNAYTGHSSLAGHIATQLVEAGVTGQRDGIGFTYGGIIADGFDPEKVVDGLGEKWLLADGYFKLHSAGRYSHAAIDALQDALCKAPGGRVTFDDVERIEVKAFQLAAMLGGRRVTTSFGAKFSIPFALSTILYHGRSDLSCFDEKAVANPAVAGLAQRVQVVEEPAYTAAYPGRHLCDVVIHLRGGVALAGRCEIMKGDPGNPHRPEEVEQKFFDVTAPVWGAARARWLYDALMNLETIPDLREFSRDVML
jgi:2-methylcitrate dehydratase PrpD